MQAIKKYTSSFASVSGDVLKWIAMALLKGFIGALMVCWRYTALVIALVFLYFGNYSAALMMFILAFYFALTDISDAINKQTETLKYKVWK